MNLFCWQWDSKESCSRPCFHLPSKYEMIHSFSSSVCFRRASSSPTRSFKPTNVSNVNKGGQSSRAIWYQFGVYTAESVLVEEVYPVLPSLSGVCFCFATESTFSKLSINLLRAEWRKQVTASKKFKYLDTVSLHSSCDCSVAIVMF